MSKKKRVTNKLKDELVHYFIHNEIEAGESKDIASVIDQFVPNPHVLPIAALKQAMKEKKFVFLFNFSHLPPVLPPVDGVARTNHWVLRVLFRYGRYFRYEMEYYNSYDDNRKECYRKVLRNIKYKRKAPLDEKALYLKDLILTNMPTSKKDAQTKSSDPTGNTAASSVYKDIREKTVLKRD